MHFLTKNCSKIIFDQKHILLLLRWIWLPGVHCILVLFYITLSEYGQSFYRTYLMCTDISSTWRVSIFSFLLQLNVTAGNGKYVRRPTFAPYVYNRIFLKEKVSNYTNCLYIAANFIIGPTDHRHSVRQPVHPCFEFWPFLQNVSKDLSNFLHECRGQ